MAARKEGRCRSTSPHDHETQCARGIGHNGGHAWYGRGRRIVWDDDSDAATEEDWSSGGAPKRLQPQLQPVAGEEEGETRTGPEARATDAGSPPADTPQNAPRPGRETSRDPGPSAGKPSREGGTPPADRPEGAHASLELRVGTEKAVERVWRAYWLPMLVHDGKLVLERLKGELFDAWHLVNEARRVYHHVTGGVTDDLTASADGIIAMADRRFTEKTEELRNQIRDLEAENRVLRERIQKTNGHTNQEG